MDRCYGRARGIGASCPTQAQVADGPTRALLRRLLHPDPAVRAAFDFADALETEPFFRLAIGSTADEGEGMSRLRLERNAHGKLCYVVPEKIDKVTGSAIRLRVQARVKGPIDSYNPEVVLSYATSQRFDDKGNSIDDDGNGPAQ